eukprot:TRINITY_DN530_c3_g1_i1.p1 TRINITY_DN530_c3_g1~~TRINITY_DN530_c3_g1_i1.p1  ORF type:complete len:209 (+),score=55.71 TRINITY_DN530_c3_g1_i1:256-882(+)
MPYRGRGRGGRGGGHMYSGSGKSESFILFPEDVVLPNARAPSEEEISLVLMKVKLEQYWEASPYYLEEESSKSKSQAEDIEQYCGEENRKAKRKRDPLPDFLHLSSTYFPVELLQGVKKSRHAHRKLRWDPESDLKKFDLLEKLEGDEKHGKVKKEEGNEDEEVGQIEEEDDEYSDDGDYNQNIDFDDDEDDLNMDDGGDDELTYDDS